MGDALSKAIAAFVDSIPEESEEVILEDDYPTPIMQPSQVTSLSEALGAFASAIPDDDGSAPISIDNRGYTPATFSEPTPFEAVGRPIFAPRLSPEAAHAVFEGASVNPFVEPTPLESLSPPPSRGPRSVAPFAPFAPLAPLGPFAPFAQASPFAESTPHESLMPLRNTSPFSESTPLASLKPTNAPGSQGAAAPFAEATPYDAARTNAALASSEATALFSETTPYDAARTKAALSFAASVATPVAPASALPAPATSAIPGAHAGRAAIDPRGGVPSREPSPFSAPMTLHAATPYMRARVKPTQPPSAISWAASIDAVTSARERLAFPALDDEPLLPLPVPDAVDVLAIQESSDLPEAVMFGDHGTSTADILSEIQNAARSSELSAPTTAGYHAGPGSRARLVMDERAYLKASTIVAASGRLSMTPAMSQLQGRTTATPFGDPSDPMCLLEGRAVVLIRVNGMAVALRGVRDLHVVASSLMGFDEGFDWDNGKILGLDVVTLRGAGSLLLDTRGAPMLIPVDAEMPVHAAIDAVLAWSDGVRPSPVEGGNGEVRLFRLRGRGYVLVAFPPESNAPERAR